MDKVKIFSYLDVLAVIHKREYSDGVYQLLNYLTGKEVDYNNCLELTQICRNYLIDLFPNLDSVFVQQAFTELDRRLETKDVLCASITIDKWLTKYDRILSIYGKDLRFNPMKEIPTKPIATPETGNLPTAYGFEQIRLIKKQYGW